jgi:hypothetical protein
MVSIERKSKFERSKAIYRKKLNRIANKDPDIFYKCPNLEKRFIDGLKIKPLTNEVLKRLLKNKDVIKIEGVTDINLLILLSFNKNFLIGINYDDNQNYGELVILNYNLINSVIIKKQAKYQYIKNNFNIINKQIEYFKSKNCLSKLPKDISNIIQEYINIIDYKKLEEYNIENPIDLYNYLKNSKIPINVYSMDHSPVLYSKIINVKENHIELKVMDLNGIFINELVNVELNSIELITINIFERDKMLEEYFNNNLNENPHDLIIKKINKNYSFNNLFENNNNIYRLEGENTIFNLEEEEIIILNYLIENPSEIKKIKDNYDYRKNIVENIQNNFNFEIFIENINNYDNLININFKDGDNLNNLYILENNSDNLLLNDGDSIFIVYKKYINFIKKTFSRIKKRKINSYYNKNLEKKVCWIKTENIDWCFYIEKETEKELLVRSFHSQCCISKNILKIKKESIYTIEIKSEYLKFIKNCYDKYKNTSILNNYQNLYNEIIELKGKLFEERLGINWYIDTINMLEEYKVLIFTVSSVNKKEYINFEVELNSLYKIKPFSFKEDNN